jgi:hypothetical protein
MRQDATVRPGLVRPIRWPGTAPVAFLLGHVVALAGASPAGPGIDVLVVDPSNRPVAHVRIQIKSGQSVVSSAETDQKGHAGFTELKPALYDITAIKDGFEPAQKADLNLTQGGSVEVELTLVPTLARQESIEVKGTVAPVTQGSSPPNELPAQSVKELPGRPATVADALPLVPGVVRSPGGGLVISAAGEHRSALIVNSADVTDPATGQFGLTVPIDSVETLNVYQTPFQAEYGRFTAGLVSVETRRGGDKWKWELNDPFPDFYIRRPDAGTHNYTATLADRLGIGGGLLENTLSVTRFDARVWGQGSQDLTIAPGGNTGSYFAQQTRNASRIGWTPVYSFAALNWLGTHDLKAGAYMAESTDNGQVSNHPVDIVGSTNQLLERIAFTPGQPFRMWDTEYAFFGQDHWIVSPRLAVDLGIRAESQELSESFRVAPRVGLAWSPFRGTGTVIRAGFGLFYDRVPLSVYSFDHYPNQVVTLFNAGQVSAGPFLYRNGLGEAGAASPFVFQEPVAGNFSPRSATGSVQVEQPLSEHLRLRVGYMQNQSAGLVILNRVAPDPATNTGANLLSGGGQSRYRQFEVTARVRLNDRRQLFFSYVRARARGDLNDFASYLGSFPVPILRANQFGNLRADLPNRFLAWGLLQLPWDFQNLTNHFNPEAFHNNIADPACGLCFGQRGRRFTADFDVIF